MGAWKYRLVLVNELRCETERGLVHGLLLAVPYYLAHGLIMGIVRSKPTMAAYKGFLSSRLTSLSYSD